MAATGIVAPTGRSIWTVELRSRERAFGRARRHSRQVRVLRNVLPLLILGATAGITVTTYLNRLLAPLPAKIDSLVVSGSKITMDRPRLVGFTRDARAYELSAAAAVQDIAKKNEIELKGIDAKVQMQDRSTVQLKAPSGFYNSKKETLRLDRDIVISSTSGYEGRLKEAMIDIRSGHVQSDRPVALKMLQGTLNANRLEIAKSGELIRLDRGVHMVMMLNEGAINPQAAIGGDNPDGSSRLDKSQSGHDAIGAALTRLPPIDPRRAVSMSSARRTLVWLRLPRHDPRHFSGLVTGSIR